MSFKADILFLDEPGWVRIHLKRGTIDIVITYDVYSQKRSIFRDVMKNRDSVDFEGLTVSGGENIWFIFSTKFTSIEVSYSIDELLEAFLDIDKWINEYIDKN